MSELWRTEALGKYCYIKARIGWRGLAASEYTESGPFLIAGKHIESGRIDWDAADHITDFRYRESSEIALAERDVILSKDGTIGRVARIDSLPGKATINGTMMLVRPEREIDYRFLYHVLNGAEFKKLIKDKVSGSSIPHIFQRDMVTLPVSFPPMAHQAKLAEVLDTLDTAIHETETIIAKLKAVKQGLLHDLLTRGIDANGELRPPQAEAPHCYKESPLGWIPKEWHCSRLEKTCSRIGDGVHYAVKRSHEGVPFLFVSSIRDGRINWCDAAFVSRKTYQEISKRARPTTGMVLFTVVGSYGHAAHVDDDHEFGFERNIAFVIPDKRSLVSRYLFHFLTSTLAHSQVEKLVIGNAQKVLTLSALGSIVATTPATCEQDEICLRIDSITERQRSEEAGLEKLHYEKSGLMDDLLTGRVRVTPLLEATAP